MATKNISINKEVNLRDFFGALSKESALELENNINKRRKENKRASNREILD